MRGIDLGETPSCAGITPVGVRMQPLCQESVGFLDLVCGGRSRHRQGLIGVSHARTPQLSPARNQWKLTRSTKQCQFRNVAERDVSQGRLRAEVSTDGQPNFPGRSLKAMSARNVITGARIRESLIWLGALIKRSLPSKEGGNAQTALRARRVRPLRHSPCKTRVRAREAPDPPYDRARVFIRPFRDGQT